MTNKLVDSYYNDLGDFVRLVAVIRDEIHELEKFSVHNDDVANGSIEIIKLELENAEISIGKEIVRLNLQQSLEDLALRQLQAENFPTEDAWN